MNFFEGELHRMFGGNDIIHDPKIVGRTLLGKLDDDLRVKLQFVSTGVHKHYDAIQISILNRTDVEHRQDSGADGGQQRGLSRGRYDPRHPLLREARYGVLRLPQARPV